MAGTFFAIRGPPSPACRLPVPLTTTPHGGGDDDRLAIDPVDGARLLPAREPEPARGLAVAACSNSARAMPAVPSPVRRSLGRADVAVAGPGRRACRPRPAR